MKTTCGLLFVLCLVFVLMGCRSESTEYALIHENGHYYVDMNLGPKPKYNAYITAIGGTLRFDSLDEMVRDFQTGNFSEEEFKELEKFYRGDDGRIEIPNLSNLAEPIAPASLGAYRIHVSGDSWSFNYKPANAKNAHVYISDAVYHNKLVEEFLHYEAKLSERNQVAVTQVPERNARVYTWVANGKTCKRILYSISANETVYYVNELYADAEGETIVNVYLWFEYQGEYLYVTINEPTERPSVEWLTSFGVKPYEG